MVVTKLEIRRNTWWPKRMILSLAVVVLLAGVVCTGLSVYVGWSLTHPAHLAVTTTPDSEGLAYESIEFPSRIDQLKLKGWYLPPAEGVDRQLTVIMAHGYKKNRLQDDVPGLKVAKALVNAGYGVVMFDFRNSGESEGSMTSVGVYEVRDLLGVFDWTKANHPGKIGLIGFSMGATTAILAAGQEPEIAGVIADSPFNHLTRYLRENLPVWSHVPSFPFTPLILSILPHLEGFNPDEADALTASDSVYPRPMLLIHSVDDTTIPYTNSESIWQRHPDKFQFWKTSKAGHVGSYKEQSAEYEQRILAFIQTW